LHQTGDGQWDFSDSLLLYASAGETAYEAVQNTDTPYHELVTAPERAYLERIADEIVSQLPDKFLYVDLGPGTEHKEQFIFDAARRQGKTFTYVPVDISKAFLDASETYAQEQGIPTAAIQSSFEGLQGHFKTLGYPVFVSLGLTYSNYPPEEAIKMLKNIAGPNGYVFINSQLRDRVDMQRIREIYSTPEIYAMCDAKMALLGFNPETDIARRETTDGVQVFYTVRNVPPALQAKGMKEGDRILVMQSLRPTKESMRTAVGDASEAFMLFDTDESFVGALLKTETT
jgi:hypothetical protein